MECRMPLCYGGGIASAKQATRIFNLGVEKISISSSAIKNPSLISELAESVGSQSVVVVLDIKKKYFGNDYNILINNEGKTGVNLINFVSSLKELGAGEVVLNSIDRDGTMQGYDFGVIDDVRANTTLPLTILGGAGALDHISELISRYGIIGAAAGSLLFLRVNIEQC